MTQERPTRRRSMVGWYDPRVLAHSAYQVAIANIFGRHSDTRLIEALASQPQGEFNYSAPQGDFWFDYVADIGDGWNSTFAIADAIARPALPLQHNGATVNTQSGKILRLRGKGLKDVNGYETGDQLIHVNVWTPDVHVRQLSRVDRHIHVGSAAFFFHVHVAANGADGQQSGGQECKIRLHPMFLKGGVGKGVLSPAKLEAPRLSNN